MVWVKTGLNVGCNLEYGQKNVCARLVTVYYRCIDIFAAEQLIVRRSFMRCTIPK